MRFGTFFLFLLVISFYGHSSLHCNTVCLGSTAPVETTEPPVAIKDAVSSAATPSYNYQKEFLNMLLNLGFLIALIVAGAWIVKKISRSRLRNANDSNTIKIIERRAISPKAAIYIVEVCGKSIVIGETPAGLHALTELETRPIDYLNEEPPPPKKGLSSFAEILKNKILSPNKPNSQ